MFGAIAGPLTWRWLFYIQLIIFGAFFPFLFLIKETRGPVILARKIQQDAALQPTPSYTSAKSAAPSLTAIFYDAVVRPAYMLCTEPIVFFLTLWTSFCFGLIFLATQSIAQIYSTNYGFSDSQVGLVQVALFVGESIGFMACLPQNRYYMRSAARNLESPGVPIPEARLPLSVFASFLGLVGGLFFYAWTSYPFLPWILPAIGLVSF